MRKQLDDTENDDMTSDLDTDEALILAEYHSDEETEVGKKEENEDDHVTKVNLRIITDTLFSIFLEI